MSSYRSLLKDVLRMMGNKSTMKIIGLIWILIENSLISGTIFGFASLFSVLPRYGIYGEKCKTSSGTKDCQDQMAEYQLAFALGIGFYNLPAVIVGMINDFFGPRSLKLMAIVFHLISWFSLGFVAPGRDWLIFFHTIFVSFAGICTLLSSVSISAHFAQRRGLVTSLISGAQLTGSIWYAIFQILIEKEIISLSTLSFIWASFALLMLGSAFLFLDWRFTPIPSLLKIDTPVEPANKDETVKVITSSDSLGRHLTNPLFILVTLFLSCLILIISFLPIIWFPWLMYLTGNDLPSTNHYTFLYNMSAVFGIVFAPICGLILDYKVYRGHTQKMLNISILQTLTWISSVALCIVCMFLSLNAAIIALIIFTFSRPILVGGSQALIAAGFPPRFIGSLLGVMWTTVGIISFSTYGLVRLAPSPIHYWRAWTVILCLCLIMIGHLFQVWILYFKSKKTRGNRQPSINEEELQAFNNNS